MTLGKLLLEAWDQVLARGLTEFDLGGTHVTVGSTRAKNLRTVAFRFQGFDIEGIEQNPEKESRWAKLAREGNRIMQFSCRRRYFANVCEGKVTRYPAWTTLGLPD